MIMSSEDKWQECERIKLEHPNYQHYQVSRDLIDVMRSRKWSNSYGKSFRYYSYEGILEKMDNEYYPFAEYVINQYSYDPTAQIESTIDLMTAINALPKQHKKVMLLFLNNFDRIEIAKKMRRSQSRITQIFNEAIKQMRKTLCHPEP